MPALEHPHGVDCDGGRALDEFTVFCPQQRNLDQTVDGLALLPGVLVEGVWPTHGIPGVDQGAPPLYLIGPASDGSSVEGGDGGLEVD